MDVADVEMRLTKDLRLAAATLSEAEARYLVDEYYLMQKQRIRTANQVRALGESVEPHSVIGWLRGQSEILEGQVRAALNVYAGAKPLGEWAMSVCGVGPVIAAGLLAHIDCRRPTAGHVWRFAGLDSTSHWIGREKAKALLASLKEECAGPEDAILEVSRATGAKPENIRAFATAYGEGKLTWASLEKAASRCPWNARLKTLCWKIGESFVKVQANEADVYGKMFVERKAAEWVKNMAGDYRDQAAAALKVKRFGSDTDARLWLTGRLTAEAAAEYLRSEKKAGQAKALAGEPGSGVAMLPPAHIHARARRYAVKLFLAHYWSVGHFLVTGDPGPNPYALAVLGHAHEMSPPNMDLVPGYEEAMKKRRASVGD